MRRRRERRPMRTTRTCRAGFSRTRLQSWRASFGSSGWFQRGWFSRTRAARWLIIRVSDAERRCARPGRGRTPTAGPTAWPAWPRPSPPTTARPSGAVCSPPSPRPSAIGTMPAIIARLVMRIGRRRLRAPSTRRRRSAARRRAMPAAFGEGHQQDRVRHGHADGHDRAHERLNVQRRARQPEHQDHAGDHRRHGRHDQERQLQRLEVRRQQQEDHHHRQQQPGSQAVEHLLQRHDLAAHGDVHSRRRAAQLLRARRALAWPRCPGRRPRCWR